MQLRPVCLPTQLVPRLLRLWALAMLLQALLPGLRSPKKSLVYLRGNEAWLKQMESLGLKKRPYKTWTTKRPI